MASERQREANRRNGRKGGPKTTEGKQSSRLNSLKHGLTSSALVVLPEEDRQEYEEVLRSFRESFQPAGGIEEALVLRLAQAHWRSLRSRSVETGMLGTSAQMQRRQARRMVENCPEHLNLHGAIGVGFMAMPAERWAMYLRYDATISRDFFRTLDTLTRLQRLRQRQARPANNPPPEPQPALVYTAGGGGAQLSENGIRSVSQNSTPEVEARESASTLPANTPNEEQTNHQHEPKESGHRQYRGTPRSARRLSHKSAHAPDRLRRKQRDLRRLPATARGLPRSARRTNQGYRRKLDQHRSWGKSVAPGTKLAIGTASATPQSRYMAPYFALKRD